MRKSLAYILWGLLFISVAVGLAGNIFGLWSFSVFFPGWWTIFIILPAFIAMIQNGIRISNTIALSVGVLILLDRLSIIPDNLVYKIIGPAILFIVGILIIIKAFTHKRISIYKSSDLSDDNPDYLAIFSGSKFKNNSPNFIGGNATAIFGGNEIDLSDVILKDNCTFNVTSIFGANEIKAPRNAKIVMNGFPIFGGNENKARSSDDPNAYTITFTCTSIFGGTEIM